MEESSQPSPHIAKGYQKKPTINKAVFIIVFAILLTSSSFYAGIQYQKDHGSVNGKTNNTPASSNGVGGFGSRGRFSSANRVIGQVTAISASSITVQDTRSGTSSTLAIVSSTQITDNGSSVTASDIQSGETVFITKDSTNPSNASSIIVNPGFGGNGSGPTQSTTNLAPNTSTN